MVISIIGVGVIGSAVAKALIASGEEESVVAADKRIDLFFDLEKKGIETTTNNKKAAEMADVLILCVKPKDAKTVLTEIREEIKGKLVLSIVAAINLNTLKKYAPEARFVRAIPNLAILVRKSFTAYCKGSDVTAKDISTIKKILGTLGFFIEVEEEKMDAFTSLSGCAPGYLAFIIDALIKGGTEVGIPPEMALTALAHSIIGTGKLILNAKKTPLEIMKMVATPGGVTEEELKELEKYSLPQAFKSMLQVGTKKCRKILEMLEAEDR